jgi:Domain of unknown function (DUF4340)
MIRRTTGILLVVFVFLIGFAWFYQRYQQNKAENTATPTPTVVLAKLYALAGKQVDNIKITDSSGKQLELYRDPTSDQWAVTGTPADQADTFQIKSVSAQLFDLQIQDTMDASTPPESMGLATPAYTLSMTTSDGTQFVTYVGSLTPTGSGYYVRVGSGATVIVNKLVMDDILALLKAPPLLPTATPVVTLTGTPSSNNSSPQVTPSP